MENKFLSKITSKLTVMFTATRVSSKNKSMVSSKRFLMVRWLNSHLNIGLPEELYDRIKKHREIRWAAVAREFLIQYLDELEKVKQERPRIDLKLEKIRQ